MQCGSDVTGTPDYTLNTALREGPSIFLPTLFGATLRNGAGGPNRSITWRGCMYYVVNCLCVVLDRMSDEGPVRCRLICIFRLIHSTE